MTCVQSALLRSGLHSAGSAAAVVRHYIQAGLHRIDTSHGDAMRLCDAICKAASSMKVNLDRVGTFVCHLMLDAQNPTLGLWGHACSRSA